MLVCVQREHTTDDTHEAITIMSPFRNMSAFINEVHKIYPEINLEVIPYSGKNYTAYVRAQLRVGDMPDIYCATYYVPERDEVSDKLIDMSGYGFTDHYAQARLREVTDHGAIYMLPTYYDCIGITYNKTLLEQNGWELPSSFRELEKLAPEVEAAGYRLALTQLQLPGYGFQYLCNILDTSYFNTPDGRKWQKDFLEGNTRMADSPEVLEALSDLEQWKAVGMLNNEGNPLSSEEIRLMMAQGDTLFMLGNANTFSTEETTDEFGLMPYLSADGTQNAFILQVSRYMGLNKHLEDAGNEQKLQDAIHVMEVLSTVDGMQALNSAYANTSLLSLKDYEVNSKGYYARIEDQLNEGETAPFIYSGWENIIVPVGNEVIDYIQNEATLDDIVHVFDDNQHLLSDNTSAGYTIITEKLDTDACARAVGICFARASGADMALISKNKWYELSDDEDLNFEGVSGNLFALPLTDQEITSILPTGWRGNILTVTLTGQRIRELAQDGYDRNGDGNTFPYELVTPQGFEIQDTVTYTVAVCGVTEEIAQEGKLTDTGILGLTAAQDFFSQYDTFSTKDIVWEQE